MSGFWSMLKTQAKIFPKTFAGLSGIALTGLGAAAYGRNVNDDNDLKRTAANVWAKMEEEGDVTEARLYQFVDEHPSNFLAYLCDIFFAVRNWSVAS